MTTFLNAQEAAEILNMSPKVLKRKAYKGEIPGKKPGKSWVFVKEHLADWVSGRYPESNSLRIESAKLKEKTCPSTNAVKRGGSISSIQMDQEYVDLLTPKINKKRKNSMTV